jgi:hypothetical protein
MSIWNVQGQEPDEDCGTTRSCKKLANLGFDDMAGPDGDLHAAWRAVLARDGKLNEPARGARWTTREPSVD